VATALLAAKPEFEAEFRVLASGDFETHVPAPTWSQAGALIVTTNDGNIWVHFSPPQMWYSVDDADELLSVIEQLMSSEAVFVRIEDENGVWIETTVMRASENPNLKNGQRATVLSWSGEFDRTVGPL